MKSFLTATAIATLLAAPVFAADAYDLDPGHSQIVFTYDHAGFSTTYGMFSGFTGEVMFDAENPAASSVSVTFPAESMITGFDPRTQHFLNSGDFFNVGDFPDVTFVSTSIEVTGDDTANITGDLTLNGVTQSIVLDTTLNAITDEYPLPPNQGKKGMGLDASVTLNRSDFNLGLFAPFIPEEIPVIISVEAIGQ